jgi:ribosomal protein S18 acetylase RimI-like enzyme
VVNNLLIRSAISNDSGQISNIVNTAHFIHRHLDWRSPVQWIGHPPFWVIEKNSHIIAALACPPDPTGVSWIRLFISTLEQHPEMIWNDLFPKVINELNQMNVNILVAIAIQYWFEKILMDTGFTHIQDVVVLRYDESLLGHFTSAKTTIRRTSKKDISAITAIDHAAFSPLWQMDENAITIALDQAYLATIAEYEGEIVGYQISTFSGGNVHLARLAVLPELQNMHIGKELVTHLLENCKANHFGEVTVNTQDDNIASLALYRKMGFLPTGDRFPVFSYRGFISE